MSRQTPNRHLRWQRSLSPDWLSEKVKLHHTTVTASSEFGGGEEVDAWARAEPVWATVKPYDQFVSVLRDYSGFENTPIELVVGIRKSQNPPIDTSVLKATDTLEWDGREYVISHVDRTVWVDGLALYVIGQR